MSGVTPCCSRRITAAQSRTSDTACMEARCYGPGEGRGVATVDHNVHICLKHSHRRRSGEQISWIHAGVCGDDDAPDLHQLDEGDQPACRLCLARVPRCVRICISLAEVAWLNEHLGPLASDSPAKNDIHVKRPRTCETPGSPDLNKQCIAMHHQVSLQHRV